MSNFENKDYSLDDYNHIEPERLKLKQDSLGFVKGKLLIIKNMLNKLGTVVKFLLFFAPY